MAAIAQLESKNNECIESLQTPDCDLPRREQSFFNSTGVLNGLFQITQSKDKGKGDGQLYAYYAPSSATLRLLGIKNVSGEQNVVYLNTLKIMYDDFELAEYSVASDPNPSINSYLDSGVIPAGYIRYQ